MPHAVSTMIVIRGSPLARVAVRRLRATEYLRCAPHHQPKPIDLRRQQYYYPRLAAPLQRHYRLRK